MQLPSGLFVLVFGFAIVFALGFVALLVFGKKETGKSTRSAQYRYRLDRDALLTAAERSFFGVLQRAAGREYIICPKVNMADVFWTHQRGGRSRIDRKHIDFLLCCPDSMTPRLGIELDDSSHNRASAKKRDAVKDEVFADAGLPLLRVPVRMAYDVREVAGLVLQASEKRA